MKDLLLLSNGHGEDDIACKIFDALRQESERESTIDGWPMVGEGAAYRVRGIPIVGTPNLLPSAGFATLSWRLMLQDLRAGWIGTHLTQMRTAHTMKGRYRMLLAVGDIVPLSASVLARIPFFFVGSAKSSHYKGFGRYTWLEKRLLRIRCRLTFPRDQVTAEELTRAGIPNRYVGNPMMDDLEGTGDRFGIADDRIVIAMLPGSRADAENNLLDLMVAVLRVESLLAQPVLYRFVFAVRSALDPQTVQRLIERDERTRSFKIDCGPETLSSRAIVLRAVAPKGAEVLLIKDRFADVLRRATMAVGMAGTANEQAVGLGLPLVTAPSSGVQGNAYVTMKMQLFGEAAIAVHRDPGEIASAIAALLSDPERRARMGRAGRERMGQPGASRTIAREILAV